MKYPSLSIQEMAQPLGALEALAKVQSSVPRIRAVEFITVAPVLGNLEFTYAFYRHPVYTHSYKKYSFQVLSHTKCLSSFKTPLL